MLLGKDTRENIRMIGESVNAFTKSLGGVAHARKQRFNTPGFNKGTYTEL